MLEGGERVGRASARADGEHDVLRANVQSCEVPRSRFGVILGSLFLRRHRDDPVGRERRPALRGIGPSGAARRAGADVDKPPAGLEPLDDRVDRARDRLCGVGHGAGDRSVLVVDEPDELSRWSQVEVAEVDARRLRCSPFFSGQGRGDRFPDERRVGCREVRHVAAGFIAPRPHVLDPGSAGRGDGRLQVGNVVAGQSEAR